MIVLEATAGQPRLLLVDDDRLVLATLADGLRRSRFSVTSVASAAEAVRFVGTHDFDLAILDLRMPEMNGIELAKQLRAIKPLPVMFLSAYGDAESARLAAQHGTISFLVEPLDVRQLLPSIEAALARDAELSALRASEARLNETLAGEHVIRMAIGVLMERRNLDRQSAFEVLRGYARSQRRKIHDVASELLGSLEMLNLQVKRVDGKSIAGKQGP